MNNEDKAAAAVVGSAAVGSVFLNRNNNGNPAFWVLGMIFGFIRGTMLYMQYVSRWWFIYRESGINILEMFWKIVWPIAATFLPVYTIISFLINFGKTMADKPKAWGIVAIICITIPVVLNYVDRYLVKGQWVNPLAGPFSRAIYGLSCAIFYSMAVAYTASTYAGPMTKPVAKAEQVYTKADLVKYEKEMSKVIKFIGEAVSSGNYNWVKEQQRSWKKGIQADCYTDQCFGSAYAARLDVLKQMEVQASNLDGEEMLEMEKK